MESLCGINDKLPIFCGSVRFQGHQIDIVFLKVLLLLKKKTTFFYCINQFSIAKF